ncbi:MAG: hypothetical protein ACXVC6_04105 [Bacteroidia bacterium]
MKIKFIASFMLFSLVSSGQTEKIKSISTTEQAKVFIKTNSDLNGEIIEINSTDNSEIAKKIIAQGAETPVVTKEYTYKMLDTRASYLLNAFYIYLDGNKLSLPQIDSVRQIILSKFNSGTPFAQLAKEFNMDGNPDPNLKSVAEGYLVTDFSEAVKTHKNGEVFKIDVPDKKWYYVTQKTADNQASLIYSVLKVKNKN